MDGKRGGEREVEVRKSKKRAARGRDQASTAEADPGDLVRIVPFRSTEEWLQPVVRLSKLDKAPGLELSSDQLAAWGRKGFRSVRATHGAHDGTWFCEARVEALGASGHVRLGWGTSGAEINAPVGYDAAGYGLRDVDGSKVHKALREPYAGAGFGQGDVVGLLLHMPPGGRPLERRAAEPVRYKGALWLVADADEPAAQLLAGACVGFSINGAWQGPAFSGLPEGTYYPMASLFTLPEQAEGARVSFNFGATPFVHGPPQVEGLPAARPLSELPGVLAAAREADEAAAMLAAGVAPPRPLPAAASQQQPGAPAVGEDAGLTAAPVAAAAAAAADGSGAGAPAGQQAQVDA